MDSQGKLLIVDGEPGGRDSAARWFREEGYEIGTADSASQALARMAENKWDVALVDLKLRGGDGIELQRRLHELDPDLIVILMTGSASVEAAVSALKSGVYDYVSKPLDHDEIAHLVSHALSHRRAVKENARLRETVAQATRPGDLVGQSPAMRKVARAIETVGPTDANVLITGESGTGKELVVRAIHAASLRRFHPLVAIHCGALTETGLESELFGHETGALGGAQYPKKGKFEVAEGGTVFLDEIGDISLKTQTDLLRVFEEREITRIGGNRGIPVDFRCVSATSRNLETMMEEGTFRPDLFYRLNVFRIELPPLRERREDIPLLVEHFVRKFSSAMNKRIIHISPAAVRQLEQLPWTGNVRELENAVERAMVVAQEPELGEQDFRFRQTGEAGASGKSLDQVERAHILKVLEECGGNQSRAAEVLDIDRVTLHHKLKRYGWSRAAAGGRT